MTRATQIKHEELARMGFGEEYYQQMRYSETVTEKQLCDLVEKHILWPYLQCIKGFGKLTAAKFIAAAGDITRTETVSSFWKGMGLDVLPDGTVPRRLRGKQGVCALPHVIRVGEQIRQAFMVANGRLKREYYDRYRAYYDAKFPDRPKTFNDRAAKRVTQKILYACIWKVWREGLGLPAPDPYAFDLLKHSGSLVRIQDLYDRAGEVGRQLIGASGQDRVGESALTASFSGPPRSKVVKL